MHRTTRLLLLLLLVLATLVAASSCDDGTGTAPPGEVRGIVMVDGAGLPGIDVELSGGERREVTTGEGGRFSFTDVPTGAYVVTIDGVPGDAAFSATSRTAVIGREAGQRIQTVDFLGSYIRTSSISGLVTARDVPVPNVGVRIEGPDTVLAASDGEGRYRASGLRRGHYAVTVSGYPTTITFPSSRIELDVEAGESATADFAGEREVTATVVLSGLWRRLESGAREAVDPADVRGTIEVDVEVDRGQETPEAVDLFMDDDMVGRQLFNPSGAALREPSPDTDDAPAASGVQQAEGDEEDGPDLRLTFTVDTDRFDPASAVARFLNGEHLLSARLTTREGGEGVWTSAVPIVLGNPTGFAGVLESERGPVGDAEGRDWIGGAVAVTVRPVYYDEQRTVASIVVELRREGGGTVRERSASGGAPFHVAFPASGEPESTNVASYQTPSGGADLLRVRSATFADGTVTSEPVVLVAPVRIDNVAPPAGTFALPRQDAEWDCCLGNWVGEAFAFAAAFDGPPDAGVGDGQVTFHAGSEDLSDAELEGQPPVTTGGDLPESATNGEYRAVAVVRDALDNPRTIALEPSDGNPLSNVLGAVFGVDRTPPEAWFASGSVPDRAVNPASGAAWEVRAEDRESGFSATPARTNVRRLAPGLDGSAACAFPGTPDCRPAPDGLTRDVPGSGQAYFAYGTQVLDRAGNASGIIRSTVLRDTSAPVVEEVEAPSSAPGGSGIEVGLSASDGVDLHRAETFVRFDGTGGLDPVQVPFAPPDTVGVRFDGSPIGFATASAGMPLVAALERADAGTDGTAPSGVLRPLVGVRALARDAAGNEGHGDAAVAATGPGPTSFSTDARGDAEGVAGWELDADGSSVCAPRSAPDDGDACDGGEAVLTLGATAVGQGGALPEPFEAVHFQAVVDGRMRWLGVATSAQMSDQGSGPEDRSWRWELDWRPETDFPSGNHPLLAVGVDGEGNALATVELGSVTVNGGG